MAIDVGSLFLLEIVGISFLIGFISWIIVFVNDKLSRLGTYHTLKTRNEYYGERFLLKILKVFVIYISLFPFVYISIYISLKFLPFSDPILGYQGIIKGGPLFTIVFLILMRIMMNPAFGNVESLLKLRQKEPNSGLLQKTAETFKERILTFFSSYISLTLIVFFFYFLVQYYVLVHDPSKLPNVLDSILPSGSMPDQDSISALVMTYSALLIILTIVVEAVLWAGIPIIQTRWKTGDIQRPLTVEVFETFGLSKKDLFLYYFNKEITLIRKVPSKTIAFLQLKFGNNRGRNRNS